MSNVKAKIVEYIKKMVKLAQISWWSILAYLDK
jgi:hypothetical protein